MDQNLQEAAPGQWEFFTNIYTDHRTPNGNTVLHELLNSSQPNSTAAIKHLLTARPDLAFETNRDRETPLILASRRGYLDAVRSLIGCAAERLRPMLAARDWLGNTAVHEAVRYDHYGVTELLLEQVPDFRYERNCAGESLLYIAAEKGNAAIVELILRICDPSPCFDGPEHKTALHAAVAANSSECVRLLEELHPSATNEVDDFGWTALHYAAKFGYVQLVKLLLSKHNSLAYNPGQNGASETALHVAILNGHLDVVREIIMHCPDCWEAITGSSKNILHLAVENEHREMVEFILHHFWACELINKKDDKGNTPLHMYVATKELEGCSLVKHPCLDMNSFNHDDMTPLDLVRHTIKVTQRQNLIEAQLMKEGAVPGLRNAIKQSDNSFYKSGTVNPGFGNNLSVKPLKVLDVIKELKEVALVHDVGGGQFGYRKTCLVVATLILTVTFTAGFTVPGGFDSADGSQGMAVLYKRKAFTAFVISNSLALILSSFEVIDVIFNRDILGGKSLIMTLMEDRVSLTGVALPLMEIAFSTGLYVVLPETSIGIYVIGVGSTFAVAAYVYGALALGLTYIRIYGLVESETSVMPAFMLNFNKYRVTKFSHI